MLCNRANTEIKTMTQQHYENLQTDCYHTLHIASSVFQILAKPSLEERMLALLDVRMLGSAVLKP